MLLLDGCFIIELFLRYSRLDFGLLDDTIFTSSWMVSTLQRDLVLLENQIPFIVVECLFKLIVKPVNDDSLFEFALNFFQPVLQMNTRNICCFNRQIRHLLDLLHYCCLSSTPKATGPRRVETSFIPCATTLHEAGIGFEKGEVTKNLFELKFEKGLLKMPTLRIHKSTASLFQNLIAYEQCFHDRERLVTSYFLLMDRLVSTTGDVEMLVNKQIIENDFGSWEEVAGFLNSICKHLVVSQDFHFAGLCDQVNACYNSKWYKYKAELKRRYFTSPWTITSLTAGILLLSFAALQAVYSMLSY
ncbi:hypothetical protein Tsubulata_047893 [Turnera subulata]|uniref:Uncharacterized protein n=1 Tax=Turnera subulata TaxID=218843 RepID=A0A9Q0FQR8_9ROSI|nr:hypothetical protein Tsubulata_047893 [Turnera subulata]